MYNAHSVAIGNHRKIVLKCATRIWVPVGIATILPTIPNHRKKLRLGAICPIRTWRRGIDDRVAAILPRIPIHCKITLKRAMRIQVPFGIATNLPTIPNHSKTAVKFAACVWVA